MTRGEGSPNKGGFAGTELQRVVEQIEALHAHTILQALEILSLHADGNNSRYDAKTMVRAQYGYQLNMYIPLQKKSDTQHIYVYVGHRQ